MKNIVLMEAQSSDKKYQKKYKCPYCDLKFERSKLHIHIQNKHEELIPEGYTALRVAFNAINKKEHGTCIICGKESPWNEDKGRYERLCGDPKCKEAYKRMAAERNKKKYGTERLQTDPRYNEEVQKKALAGRKISGEYTFKDGGKVQYVGSYERKCLEFLDLVMHCNSIDITAPGPAVRYKVKDKEHLYLPDFYYTPYNLIIEIKDGGDNPNNNPEVRHYKALHQSAKEKAVQDTGKYNYVRVVNNDFSQLMSAMAVIKYQLSDEVFDPVIMINESTNIQLENSVINNNKFIKNFLKDNNIEYAHDLYDWMHKNIKYKSTGIYHSPEETIKSKSGDCHDQAELAYKCLNALGYSAGKLFLVEYYDYNKPGGKTHTLTYFRSNSINDNKVFWFENAWGDKAGIHKLPNTISNEKLFAPVFDAWDWSGKCDKLYWTLANKNIKYGSNLGEYVSSLTPEKEPKGHIYYKDKNLNESIIYCPDLDFFDKTIEEGYNFLDESYLRDEEDILYNKDKFDSGEINLCYIIGLSGSGKSTLAKDLSSSSKNIQSIELDNLISTWRFSDKRLEQLGGLIYSFFEKYPKYRIPYRATGDEITEFIRQNFKDESDYFDSIIDDFIAYSASYARSHTREKFIINGVEILHIEPSRLKDNAVYIKGTSALKSWYRSLIRDFKEAPDNRERIDWTVSKFKAIPNYVNFEKVVQQWRDYYSNIVENSVNESYIINEPDILYNKKKFDSGEINLCFIIGHSGSGKSTLGRNMAKDNKTEHYELDDLQCIKDHFTMAQLKEYGDLIYSYFNGPGKRFYITYQELVDNNIPGSEYEDKLFPGFVHYAMQYAKSHKDRKYIIEGVWLFCKGEEGKNWFTPSEFDKYAFYIKGTSMLVSKARGAKRDAETDAEGSGVYRKLDRFAKFSANFIKRNWKWYLLDEREIKVFRDHFSRLVDRDKIVK